MVQGLNGCWPLPTLDFPSPPGEILSTARSRPRAVLGVAKEKEKGIDASAFVFVFVWGSYLASAQALS